MKITHHKDGKIKTLVDEAPYHPGYEDAGFKPTPQTKLLSDEEIPFVGILQNANTVSLGSAIWESDEEFIKYKKIILATVRAMEKRMGIEAKVRGEK